VVSAAVEQDGLPLPQRFYALISTSIGTFTSTVDFGVVNVALPTISLAFGISPAEAIWIITAYQLAVVATLLLFAALGDSFGIKRVYLPALFTFMLGSIGCALSPAIGILFVMRVLQGLSSSANMVMTAPLNRMIYPRRMLGRAIANNSLFVAAGSAVGPTVGGLILAVAPWQALFWVNVPFLLIGGLFGARYLPGGRGTGKRIDLLSVVLAAAGLCTLIFGFQDISLHDAPARVLTLVGIGGAITIVFIVRQLHLAHPLLAVDLFRVPMVARSVAAGTLTYMSFGAGFVSLPFYLQRVLGRSPFETGLLLAAWPLATVIVTRIIGPLTDRYSPSLLGSGGLAIATAGFVLFALAPANTFALVAAATLCGTGMGLFQTPNNYAIIGATPPHETGRATGIITTVRTCANTFGAALVAIAFGFGGVSTAGLWISAVACALGAAISVSRVSLEPGLVQPSGIR
jgi:MFS transporter, DHA2 family, multidrug resistance protein